MGRSHDTRSGHAEYSHDLGFETVRLSSYIIRRQIAPRAPALGWGWKSLNNYLIGATSAAYTRAECITVRMSCFWPLQSFYCSRKTIICRTPALITLVLDTLSNFWCSLFKAKTQTLVFKVRKFFFSTCSHVPKIDQCPHHLLRNLQVHQWLQLK